MLHPWTALGKEPASCLWFAGVPSFQHQDHRPKDTYAPLAAGHFISLWDTLIHQDDVSPLLMDVSSGLGGGRNEHGGRKQSSRFQSLLQFRLGDVDYCRVAQSCLTLRPVDCRQSGSPVRGIFQARVVEWVAISSSRGSSRPRDGTS